MLSMIVIVVQTPVLGGRCRYYRQWYLAKFGGLAVWGVMSNPPRFILPRPTSMSVRIGGWLGGTPEDRTRRVERGSFTLSSHPLPPIPLFCPLPLSTLFTSSPSFSLHPYYLPFLALSP